MQFGWVEVAVVALVLALRLLAGGVTLRVAVRSLGALPALLFGPLVAAGFLGKAEVHPALVAVDVCLLVWALLFPDFADPDEYQVPLLMLLRGNPALRRNRFGAALFTVGLVLFAAYLIGLAVVWIMIGVG